MVEKESTERLMTCPAELGNEPFHGKRRLFLQGLRMRKRNDSLVHPQASDGSLVVSVTSTAGSFV
jgi:hypothetical protein